MNRLVDGRLVALSDGEVVALGLSALAKAAASAESPHAILEARGFSAAEAALVLAAVPPPVG